MSFSVAYSKEYSAPHPEDEQSLVILSLTGPSESGKSRFGELGLSMNLANRIKYLRCARELSEVKYSSDDPFALFNKPDAAENAENYQQLWLKLAEVARQGVRISVVESMKHHSFLEYGRQAQLNFEVRSIYIDAPFESRLAREAVRLGVDPETIRQETAEKDLYKQEMGLHDLLASADVVVTNDGSLSEYDVWISGYLMDLQQYYPEPDSTGVTTQAILYK